MPDARNSPKIPLFMKEDKRHNFPDIIHPNTMFWKEHMKPIFFKGFTLFGDVSKNHK
jgi:hypothetical protein